MGTLRALAAAALYVVFIVALHPYRGIFAFDPDEGINAIKAMLVDHGAVLYRDVWSDQPPLFTELLRGWCGAFGWDVDTARALVLLFAAATLFAVYDMLRLEAGELAAVAGAILLAASVTFPRLSVSLMIGLPAVALATLSLWALFRWRRHHAVGWLIGAGVLMGASLATKLFTAMLVPVFAAWIALGDSAASPRLRWQPALLWLAIVAAAAAILLGTLVGRGQLSALVSSHIAARRDPSFAPFGAGGLLLTSLADWPLTLIGAAGALLIVLWRRWSAVVFPMWIGVAALCLLVHRPIWYHHELLFTVPFAAAGGIILATLARRPPGPLTTAVRIACALSLALLLLWAALPSRLPAPVPLDGAPVRVLAAMRSVAGSAPSVVATDPMYTYRAQLDTPAVLAVLPMKRAVTDPTLPTAIATVFAEQPPEQVLIGGAAGGRVQRWIRQAMGDRYRRVLQVGDTELFVRTDQAR